MVRMLGREPIMFIMGIFYRIQLQEDRWQSAKGLPAYLFVFVRKIAIDSFKIVYVLCF